MSLHLTIEDSDESSTYLSDCVSSDSEPEGEEVKLGEEPLWIDTNNEPRQR